MLVYFTIATKPNTKQEKIYLFREEEKANQFWQELQKKKVKAIYTKSKTFEN